MGIIFRTIFSCTTRLSELDNKWFLLMTKFKRQVNEEEEVARKFTPPSPTLLALATSGPVRRSLSARTALVLGRMFVSRGIIVTHRA